MYLIDLFTIYSLVKYLLKQTKTHLQNNQDSFNYLD